METKVLSRFENKFIIDNATCKNIQKELLKFMELGENNKTNGFYTVSNIYYDTKDNNLIRKSLSSPKYEELLRLKAYGDVQPDSKVYLEINKKFCGLVNKRSTSIKLNEAYDFISTKTKPDVKGYMNKQIINEIEYILRLYNLEPKIYIAYDRKVLSIEGNLDFRVTFDTNIRIRRDDLKLEVGNYGNPLLESGQCLMKVEVKKTVPLWLSKLLSEHKIFSSRGSSYNIAVAY